MPFELDMTKLRHGTDLVKRGFAKMQQGGVVMDVTNAEQAMIAEEAGAVAVMALAPARDAPMTALIEQSSSSPCRNTPPTSGKRWDIRSEISLAGVMGYPAKKSQPAAMAPSAIA